MEKTKDELTEKECRKALDELYFEANNSAYVCGDDLSKQKLLLDNLIKEHFENQPLKLEELKIGMTIYQNDLKVSGLITYVGNKNGLDEVEYVFINEFGDLVKSRHIFIENIFYRKEVKE